MNFDCFQGYAFLASEKVWARPGYESFAYSDGDAIEENLYRVLSSVKDRSVLSEELIPYKIDWPTHYHLSAQRANLLRPLQSMLSGEVLELGCGCGGITRYLGETAQQVVAVEGSLRRASIAALRCQDLDNVSIVCDRIQDIDLPLQSFDVVTLIGVLEYARLFDNSDHPELNLLHKARKFLKPTGVLILAIENQLGLKYFAGFPEDHVGQAMFGINDGYRDNTVATFSRVELEGQLQAAGFVGFEQHIPLPDYKLPVTILHPAGIDADQNQFNIGELLANSVDSDWFADSGVLFSLERTWPLIARSLLVRDLANSFLYVAWPDNAGVSAVAPEILASHYGVAFRRCYAKETRFILKNDSLRVERRPLAAKSEQHDGLFLHAYEDEDYIRGESLFYRLVQVVNTDGWSIEDMAIIIAPWIDWMRAQSWEEGENKTLMLPSDFIDATPANFLFQESVPNLIDKEWKSHNQGLTLAFVAFRGLFFTLNRLTNVSPPAKDTPMALAQLTQKVLALNGVELEHECLRTYWMDVGQFHTQVFGTEWLPFECMEALCLKARKDVAVLWSAAHALEQLKQKMDQDRLAWTEKEAEYCTALADVEQQYANLKKQYDCVVNSKSWRLTKPLRVMTRLAALLFKRRSKWLHQSILALRLKFK